MTPHRGNLALLVAMVFLFIPTIALSACKEDTKSSASPVNKVSSQLTLQISLRKQQLERPSSQGLAQMQSMGMQSQNIALQRIYIYLYEPLSAAQVSELEALGITLYPNSWMPPAGNSRTGFVLADMPVDKLDDLAAKSYIVSLDTAEKPLQPQSDVQTGGQK